MLVHQIRTTVSLERAGNIDEIELLHQKYHDIYGLRPANNNELIIWITDDLARALQAPSVNQDADTCCAEYWEHILNTVVGSSSITTDELCYTLDKMYVSFEAARVKGELRSH